MALTPKFGTFDDDIPIVRESSLGETLSTSLREGFSFTPTAIIGRNSRTRGQTRTDDITDHNILNAEFQPDVPFSRPTSRSKAETIIGFQKEQRARQEIIQRGKTTPLRSFAGFAAELAGTALDPFEIIGGFGIGVAFEAAAMTNMIAKGFMRNSVLRNSVEGVVANTISEVAFVIPNTKDEKRQVNQYQNLANAVAGGAFLPVAFGALRYTAKKLQAFSKGKELPVKAESEAIPQLKDMDFRQLTQAIELTESKMAQGKLPDISEAEIDILLKATPEDLHVKMTEMLEAQERFKRDVEAGKPAAQSVVDDYDIAIDAVKQRIREKESINYEPSDIRERANSIEQNVYHNKETAKDIEVVKKEPLIPASLKVDAELEKLRFPEQVPEAKRENYKKLFDETVAEVETKKSQIDEVTDFLPGCVTNSLEVL